MKKRRLGKLVLMILCCLQMICASFPVSAAEGDEAGSTPQISAGAAVVADLDTGTFLYEKNAETTFAPGDLTKLMTVLLLTENYDLSETVSFSEIVYRTEEGSARLGLQPGEEITLYDAASAILLGNAEDVVNGVAEYAAGSRDAFTEWMNQRAQELGCQNTHFSNPNGYDSEGQYTCASDLVRILQAASQNSVFLEICKEKEYTIAATNLTETTRSLSASQRMLLQDSASYQSYCVGGMEVTSQGTVHSVAFCENSGRSLILVVLGASDTETADSEAALLAGYAFASETEQTVTEKTTEEVETETSTQDAESETPVQETEETLPETPVIVVISETQSISENELETLPHLELLPEESEQESEGSWLDRFMEGAEAATLRACEAVDELIIFINQYPETAAAVIGVLLMLVILFLSLALARHITNSRIRKRREKEKRRYRDEEERIERMSVQDLEEDMRRRQERNRDDFL